MRRGTLVTVAFSGDYGKPRPALIIQSDFIRSLDSVTAIPFTTEFIAEADDFRIAIMPTSENGLRQVSYIMVDKIGTIRRVKCGPSIGQLSETDIVSVNRALAVFLGFT